MCEQTLRILSGVYGLLRPGDLVRPYRLEMGTKMADVFKRSAAADADAGEAEGMKTLYDWWGADIAVRTIAVVVAREEATRSPLTHSLTHPLIRSLTRT